MSPHAGPSGRVFYFITHADVVIEPAVAITEWRLSAVGRERMRAGLAQPWVPSIQAVYCSAERKALDSAELLAAHRGLRVRVEPGLGENDRSSTGYLPREEFERMADAFFARPQQSVRGWERAADAQRRVVRAIQRIDANAQGDGNVAVVAHGAVGALLLAHLSGEDISRAWDQPGSGGGNYFSFTLKPPQLHGRWRAVDVLP